MNRITGASQGIGFAVPHGLHLFVLFTYMPPAP